MKKCVITVVGGYSRYYCEGMYIPAEISVNILDISQTIVAVGYFNMAMIVDVEASDKEIADIAKELRSLEFPSV